MDKEFDFSIAKRPSDIPALQLLRQAHQNSIAQNQERAFDNDVENWVAKQENNKSKRTKSLFTIFLIVDLFPNLLSKNKIERYLQKN